MRKRISSPSSTIGFRPKWPGLREYMEAMAYNGSRSLSDQVERMCVHMWAVHQAAGTDDIAVILEKIGAPKDMKIGGEQVMVALYGAHHAITQKRK